MTLSGLDTPWLVVRSVGPPEVFALWQHDRVVGLENDQWPPDHVLRALFLPVEVDFGHCALDRRSVEQVLDHACRVVECSFRFVSRLGLLKPAQLHGSRSSG